MADDIIEQQAETEPTVEQQIAEQMNFRLNGGEPPIEAAETTETQTTETETTTQTEVPAFQFQTFTEKYGWQSPDDAVKEIEELRALKSTQTVEAIKYENEQSEKLAKALQQGKFDEVYGYLDEQRRLERPKEVRQFVLQLQAKCKIETGNGKFSQQQTITKIIKEYKKLIEK